MNSTVGPIFNEKVVEKWNLWAHEQCTDALLPWYTQPLWLLLMNNAWTVAALLPKTCEKKKKKIETWIHKCKRSFSPIQTGTIYSFSFRLQNQIISPPLLLAPQLHPDIYAIANITVGERTRTMRIRFRYMTSRYFFFLI